MKKAMENNLTVAQYVECIKITLNVEGLDATNAANHEMLAMRKISLEQFQAAAKVLAAEILKR